MEKGIEHKHCLQNEWGRDGGAEGGFCLINTVNLLLDQQHLKYAKPLIKTITIVFYIVGSFLMKIEGGCREGLPEKLLNEAG